MALTLRSLLTTSTMKTGGLAAQAFSTLARLSHRDTPTVSLGVAPKSVVQEVEKFQATLPAPQHYPSEQSHGMFSTGSALISNTPSEDKTYPNEQSEGMFSPGSSMLDADVYRQ